MLVAIPGTRQAGSQTVVATLWKLLKSLTYRLSMMGKVNVGSAEYNTGAVFMVAVPTGSGTTADPAYRLKILDKMPPMLPLTAEEGDGLVFRSGQWVPGTPGVGTSLTFHPIAASRIITARTTSGTVPITMPIFPVGSTTVWALFRCSGTGTGAIGVATSSIGFYLVSAASSNTTPMAPVTATTNFVFTVTGTAQCTIDVLGYFY